MQLSLRTDRHLLRAGSRSTRNLLVSITAPAAAARAERLPVHVGIVLDRSGSMGGGKFELAREAVEQSLRMLRPDDRFTLVVFDTETDILAPAVHATPAAKREALARLAEVEPRGGTDLHSGWTTAATGLAAVLDARAITRVLLLTDGQANAGIVEPLALAAQHSSRKRLRTCFSATPRAPNGSPRMARGTMATMALRASPHVSWRPHMTPDFLAVLEVAERTGGFRNSLGRLAALYEDGFRRNGR